MSVGLKKMFYLRKKIWKKNDNKILRRTSVLKIRRCTKNLHSIKKKVFIFGAKKATFKILRLDDLWKIDLKWFINNAKKATFTCPGTIEEAKAQD